MKINIVVTDVVNDVTYSRKSIQVIHVWSKHFYYIEDIQVFGVNMSFISLSEVKNFYIS